MPIIQATDGHGAKMPQRFGRLHGRQFNAGKISSAQKKMATKIGAIRQKSNFESCPETKAAVARTLDWPDSEVDAEMVAVTIGDLGAL
jgi:hypothetical protein